MRSVLLLAVIASLLVLTNAHVSRVTSEDVFDDEDLHYFNPLTPMNLIDIEEMDPSFIELELEESSAPAPPAASAPAASAPAPPAAAPAAAAPAPPAPAAAGAPAATSEASAPHHHHHKKHKHFKRCGYKKICPLSTGVCCPDKATCCPAHCKEGGGCRMNAMQRALDIAKLAMELEAKKQIKMESHTKAKTEEGRKRAFYEADREATQEFRHKQAVEKQIKDEAKKLDGGSGTPASS